MKIAVPATSANLGSGFDSLGLAVNLYNNIYIEESDTIDIASLDSTPVPTGGDNLIFTAAQSLFALCGSRLKGLKIRQENNIPMTRGLGSSSACIIAGLVGANELLGCPLNTDALVNLAAEIEGHPDNTTPALLGGLVTAVMEERRVYYIKQEITGHLKLFAFIPDFELSTEFARGVLPETVSRRDAVHNLSRAALMSASLLEGKYENLRVAVNDRLHQPYRLGYISGASEVFDMAYGFGAYAAFISGSGSALMAITNAEDITFEEKARKALDTMGKTSWRLLPLRIDNNGAQVIQGA
ncbi:homoserine kinase [Acetanaerobacterium elongatum]|uniref:Homoserine kinase n=2 Tax=Acetanaerobacterium elongatum TaxID=258515 RepID=A0A1H0G691_9FIRM|nr:homoserine kinase [Acetanaerobacterium elongatum]